MSHDDDTRPLNAEESNLIIRLRRLRRLRELDGPEVIIEQAAKLVEARLSELAGGPVLEDAAAQHRRDLEAAAGELRVPVPEPGSHMAQVVRANALLRRRLDSLRENIVFLTSHDDEDDNGDSDDPDRMKTLYELDPEYAQLVRSFLLTDWG